MKISIITINYNNDAGLEKTIKSVVSQDYKGIEYIVIDGGSTDRSVEIINQYKQHLSYSVSEQDNGIYHAMNKGIAVAQGEFLLFLNSGDVFYDSHTISLIVKKNLTTDYIFGNMILDCGKRKIKQSIPSNLTFYHLFTHTLFHQSMFVKKAVFEQYGYYDEAVKITADWQQYLVAIFKHNCTYTMIDETIAVNDYDGISSQRSGTMQLILQERKAALEKHFPGFIEDYNELHRCKKWKLKGIIRGVKRRYQEYLAKKR